MQNYIPPDKLLSIGKSSEYLGVSIDTLRRWEKKGRITPLRSPGGHRYYSKDELDALFGKRYSRDEETLRRTDEELGKVDTSSDQSPSFPVEDQIATAPPPETSQYMKNLLDPSEEKAPPSVNQQTQIPPWRPVETTTLETSTPEKEVIPSQVEEVTTKESILKPLEVPLPEPVTENIPNQEKKDENTLTEEDIENRIHSIIDTKKKARRPGTLLIIFSALFIIADIVLLVIWLTSSKIISPVP